MKEAFLQDLYTGVYLNLTANLGDTLGLSPFSKVSKLRHSEDTYFAQSHSSQSRNLNPRSGAAGPRILTTIVFYSLARKRKSK